jgi:hypothetical protein
MRKHTHILTEIEFASDRSSKFAKAPLISFCGILAQ